MKKSFSLLIALFFVVSCGGGGGGGTTSGGTASYIGFTTDDFSGKSLYYSGGSSYQLGTFYPDGTVKASAMMTSGTPVLQQEVALWAVTNGELIISAQGDTIRYVMLSEDLEKRYFRVNKYSSNGSVSVVRIFYDQVTGLSQAQDYVANGGGDVSPAPDNSYSKFDGKYACYVIAAPNYVDHVQLEFTSTNLRLTFLDTGTKWDMNDFVGTINGYPLYTEKIPNSTTDSLGFLFDIEGGLYMTRGHTEELQKGTITSLDISRCVKQ